MEVNTSQKTSKFSYTTAEAMKFTKQGQWTQILSPMYILPIHTQRQGLGVWVYIHHWHGEEPKHCVLISNEAHIID